MNQVKKYSIKWIVLLNVVVAWGFMLLYAPSLDRLPPNVLEFLVERVQIFTLLIPLLLVLSIIPGILVMKKKLPNGQFLPVLVWSVAVFILTGFVYSLIWGPGPSLY